MKRGKIALCFAGLLTLAALAAGCVDRRNTEPEEKPVETGTEMEVPEEPATPDEPVSDFPPGKEDGQSNTGPDPGAESEDQNPEPDAMEGSGESETEEGVKEPMTGKTVRVAIRLTTPSVTAAGYPMRSITTDPEAQAYQAKLKEEQKEITRRIEEVTGHPLDVVWSFTLSTNVISANVYEPDIQKIRSVEGVVSVNKEQTYQLHG